jgi:ubiquinone/menaquinone biosynthesis C-methylase UbiE
MRKSPDLPKTVPGSQSRWEAAFERFESPAQEVAKFRRRLISLGALEWPKEASIVELFCGRGNGLHALASFGFVHLEGVDLSRTLLERYSGDALLHHGDCRNLPFPDASRDILIVQGGLHHLPCLPEDLEKTLLSAVRVLRPGGKFVVVEPWLTPFLRLVHTLAFVRSLRQMAPRLDAFATMVEEERSTYEEWLAHPKLVQEMLESHFVPVIRKIGWGKMLFVGTPRPAT